MRRQLAKSYSTLLCLVRVVIVCASTFEDSKQLTYSHKAVLFVLLS